MAALLINTCIDTPGVKGHAGLSLSAPEECHTAVCKQACPAARMPAIWMFFSTATPTETFLTTFHQALTSCHKVLLYQVAVNVWAAVGNVHHSSGRKHLVEREADLYSRHECDIIIQIRVQKTTKKKASAFRRDVTLTLKITCLMFSFKEAEQAWLAVS